MEIHVILYLIAAVLAAVGAFVNPPRISLLSLAVAVLAFAFFLGAVN